jgi:hypothetical protein
VGRRREEEGVGVSQIHILPSRTVLAVPASLIRVKEIFLNIQELRSEKNVKICK